MTNFFPPPQFPPPNVEPTNLVPVVIDHRVAWPKKRWFKLPLWAWIAAGVLAVGAIGAAAAPKKDNKQAAAALPVDSATTFVPVTEAVTTPPPTTLAATTLPPTTLPPTTLPPTTLAPTTLAPTTLAPTTLPATTVPSTRDLFVSWLARNNVVEITGDLADAFNGVSDAASAGDIYGLGAACAVVHDANARLAATLPSPSPEMNTALERMTGHYDRATHLCKEAVATLDVEMLSQSAVYMGLGNDDSNDVTALIDQI